MVVLEVVDALPLDGLLEDFGLAATELLSHLHQPGGDGPAEEGEQGEKEDKDKKEEEDRVSDEKEGSRGRWRRGKEEKKKWEAEGRMRRRCGGGGA